MNQNPTMPTPAQSSTKSPIGIKIMASLLLLVGLWIALGVFGRGMALLTLFFSGIMSTALIITVMLSIIGIILFIFTEKTAIGLFKLKAKSRENYYIAIALSAVYFAAESPQLTIFLLAQKVPPPQIYLKALVEAIIIFAILGLPFFLVTRKHIGLFK